MKAFTLIELLILIAIIVISASVVQFSFQALQNQSDLGSTTQGIISILRKAQSNTVASQGLMNYGVHFENNAYTLFQGTTYNASSTANERYVIGQRLELYGINLAQGNDVVFERIDGRTDDTGTLQLRVAVDPSASSTIVIEPSGVATLQKNIATTQERLTDSRHVHFDLGWSIQGANTLTFTFKDAPNPDTVQNVSMASYFSSPTSFAWEENTLVGGQDQTIRIATHLLTATTTALSITRDGRYNTKAVDMSIDGKAIVSYPVSGDPTVGLFGGTMELQ